MNRKTGLEYAIEFASAGWKVFPCWKGGKDPITPRGLLDATSDLEKVEAWGRSFPECNWGVVPGEWGVALDFDKPASDTNNPWPEDDEVRLALASADLVVRTPSGGIHYYWSQPEAGRWTGRNKMVPYVDARGNDRHYLILPGGRAPCKFTGEIREYALTVGNGEPIPGEAGLSSPPEVLARVFDLYLREGSPRPRGQAGSGEVKEFTGPVLDNVRTFVATSPEWWEVALDLVERPVSDGGAGGFINQEKTGRDQHGTIYYIRPGYRQGYGGYSAKWNQPKARNRDNGSPRFTVFSPNWEPFKAFDDPSWNPEQGKSYDAFDLIKTIAAANSESFWHEIEERMNEQYKAALATEAENTERSLDKFLDSLSSRKPVPALASGDGEADDFHGWDDCEDLTGLPPDEEVPDSYEIDPSVAPDRIEPFPEDVVQSFRKGGIIDLFIRDVAAREYMKQPVFRISGGLILLASLLARKVRLLDGTLPKIYVINTAPSGEGKDCSRKVLKALANLEPAPVAGEDPKPEEEEPAADKPKKRGRPRKTAAKSTGETAVIGLTFSDSGLVTALRERPDRVIIADELGAILKAEGGSKDSRFKRLVVLLTELFTTGVGPYAVPKYADEKRNSEPIETPVVNVFGVTVLRSLVESMTVESIESGFLARFMWFPGEDQAEENIPDPDLDHTQLNPKLIQQVLEWKAWKPCSASDISDAGLAGMVAWRINPEASDYLLKNARRFWLSQKRKLNQMELPESILFTRCLEIAKSLAIVIAADRLKSPENCHEVTLEDVKTACKIVDWSTNNLLFLCQRHIADSVYGRAENQILRFFKEKPLRPYSIQEIRKSCRSMELDHPATRNAILSDLEARGVIKKMTKLTGGRPISHYMSVE